MGKSKVEGIGEVQEVIDMMDYAVGLSRMLNGKVIPSERPDHFMMERWNPLGIVAVITAFNFPSAVCGWNKALSLICGNLIIWKGAETSSLLTIAQTKIFVDVLKKNGAPESVLTCCLGFGKEIGNLMAEDPRIPLVAFTGSTATGRIVTEKVHSRFGKTILELGGNNAAIIMDDANVELAIKGCVFAAVGTAG